MAVSADLIKKAREQVKSQKSYNDDQYKVPKNIVKANIITPATKSNLLDFKEKQESRLDSSVNKPAVKNTVKEPVIAKENEPWYKQSGKDLLLKAIEGLKKQRSMAPEERAKSDAEYRTKVGGQSNAYLGSRAEEGLLSFNQGALNAVATAAANTPLKFVPGAVETLKEPQNRFESQIQANAEANKPVSKGQEILGDVVSSTTRMAPSILASFVNPALGKASFAIPAGGQYAREAELEGANESQQLAVGSIGGAIEAALGNIGFIKPLSKILPTGLLDSVVKNGTANMTKNLIHIGLNTAKVALGEATEEAVTDPLVGLAKKIIYDKNKPWVGEDGVINLKEMAYDALIGGITGGVFALPNVPFSVSEAVSTKKFIDDNYDATLAVAQGLPETYESSKKAAEYTKAKYPISYDELVELQKQTVTDLADYSKKQTPVTQNKTETKQTDSAEAKQADTKQPTQPVTVPVNEEQVNAPTKPETPPATPQKVSLDIYGDVEVVKEDGGIVTIKNQYGKEISMTKKRFDNLKAKGYAVAENTQAELDRIFADDAARETELKAINDVEQVNTPTPNKVAQNGAQEVKANKPIVNNTGLLDNSQKQVYNANGGDINGRNIETGSQTSGEPIQVRTEADRQVENGRIYRQRDSGVAEGLRVNGKNIPSTSYVPDEDIKKVLSEKNKDLTEIHSVSDPDAFSDAIGAAKKENPHGAYVTNHSPEEYSKMNTFLTKDGHSGVAITKNGDIVSVFNNGEKSKIRNGSTQLLLMAIENGGKKLDNFDGKLSDIYEQHGFIPVAKTKFNSEFAPPDWKPEFGEPDIIFYAHNGDSAIDVANKTGDYDFFNDKSKVPEFKTYDEAAAYRDKYLADMEAKNKSTEAKVKKGAEESGQMEIGGASTKPAVKPGTRARKSSSKPSEVQGYSAQEFTGTETSTMPKGDDSSEVSKTVDDLIELIESKVGVPIRTGKFHQKALGIFKVKPEVIRTKVRGDMPVISHELGHYLDKKYSFSESNQFKNELLALGGRTSKQSYKPKQIRQEGVAEFVRLYLTNPMSANEKTPLFMAYFEKTLDSDTIKFLSMLRGEISAIRNLPNNKKIWSDISSGEVRKSTNKAVNIMQKFYDAWINEQGIFGKLQSYAEGKGWAGKNIDILTQIYKGFEAKAMNMLFDKQMDLDGNAIGDSMMEIMEPLSPKEVKKRKGDSIQERKDFITYMVSRRAMDYKDRGLVMPQPWYVYEDNITAMEEKYPHFIDVFEGLRKWEDNNLQLLVDSGIKTKADIETIKYMNANHVPLYRIKEAAEAIRAGNGNTLGQSKNVIKRAKGSGATIIDPLESMIVDSFIIRRAAESNNIMGELYKMASDVEGIGSMVEKVPPGMTKTSFTVQEIRKQMLKAANVEVDTVKNTAPYPEQVKDLKRAEDYVKSIEDMSDEQLESVMSIYRPLFQEKDNEVTVYVKGDKKLLQVDPQLHKAIKGLNREQMNTIMRAFNAVKKVKQAGIVTSIPFVLRNVARDTGTSLIQSESGINPADIIMGYRSAIAKDKWFKEWVASGGATEYVNINERRQAQKLEDDVLQYGISEKATMLIEAIKEVKANNNSRTQGKLINAAKNMVDIPVDMIRDAVDWSEAGARVAEYRKAVESGVDKQTAAAWSRKLSVDFLRHGYTGKQVNMIVAFFNANVQGVVRIGETFKAHPVKTMVRGLIYVTLPTMLLYALNRDDEDYQNLPEWRKAMFWNISLGNGKFFMLPKPPGYGWIFGALPEFTMNKILDDDPEAWKDIMSTFVQSFQLPTEVSAINPVIDIYANKSWTGAPIEGVYERMNTPAYLRSDEKTSLISSMIGDTLKNTKGLSPKQIDYLVKQYLGTVGETFWKLPDTIKAGIEAPSEVTQYPVIKSFIVDSAYSSASINDLYDIGEELSTRKNEFKETGTYPAMSHLPLEQQKKLFASLEAARSEYNKLAESFSDARKKIKEIKADDKLVSAVKKGKEREIRVKMNKMATDYNKKYREFKAKYKIK